MRLAEEDLKALCVERACVDKQMFERASLTTRTPQSNGEGEPLNARTFELQASAATYHGELGVVERAVHSLERRVAAREDRAIQ